MDTLSLNGAWSLQKNGRGRKMPASVPGDVYADLLTAGEIPDPFYRDNELSLQWIGESDWAYSRTFTVSQELLSHRKVLLRCDGLDTFATVTINRKPVAITDNMFRTYEWDVARLLKPGKNTIRIEFQSVLPYIEAAQSPFPGWGQMPNMVANPCWVRKQQSNFGWDWGIKALTCGIWRSISIVAFDDARLADVAVQQTHTKRDVALAIAMEVEGATRGLRADLTVLDGDAVVASASTRSVRKPAEVVVKNPKLWWPNTMGDQNLYTVQVVLKSTEGAVIDTMQKRIGLRTFELDRHDDDWGESFQFKVNGVPFFAKGTNWIPIDAILARRTPQKYRQLLEDAVAVNMNMVRVWGGGIYEDDTFYDACDELGLCVWQDFMFACAAYPVFDKRFMANVKQEALENVRRLRHHASLTLWCGNNELEMMNVGDNGWEHGQMPWDDYKRLFDDLLPSIVNQLSPATPYWPSSPHTPKGDRSKHRSSTSGDAHLWIICGADALEKARTCDHRFASEFGYQSFPEPRTTLAFTATEDHAVTSRVMELHQRAPGGNQTIMQRLLNYLPMPAGFESTLWSSQIMAGLAAKNACEHFRRNMPQTMGTLIWQLNDCWPVASWSSIDFHGRWKAMHYMARHFFAPVLVSGVEDRAKGTVAIHLTSDRPTPKSTTVSWTVTDLAGTPIAEGQKKTTAPAIKSREVKVLKLAPVLKQHAPHQVLVWLEADIEGEPLQRNLVWFAPPKHFTLSQKPGIRFTVKQSGDRSFTVKLRSRKVALWTWLELPTVDARLSNNFIHLRPGITESVDVVCGGALSLADVKSRLVARSLVDTC